MTEQSFDQNKIIEICKKHNIQLLILHGSYAGGNTTKESDIDIGILSQNKFEFKEYSEVLSDFEDVFGDKFDPAFLNGAEPMICYQTVLKGKPLFEIKPGTFSNFQAQSILRYMDTKKFRELEKIYIKKAVGKA